VALEAQAGAARTVGFDGLTLEVTNAALAINLADGAAGGGRVLDFGAGDVEVTTGTGSTRTMSMDGASGQMLSVAASFEVALGDQVFLQGSGAFEKRSDTVTLAEGTVVAVDALTLGAADIHAFVGFDGPYRSDTNRDGLIDDADAVNDEAVGLSLTDVDAALAVFSAVLSKVGAYGFLRVVLPIMPDAAELFQTAILIFAVASIIYG
jgi:hypothetical protein